MAPRNPTLDAVINELVAVGVTYEVEQSRHVRVLWTAAGRKRLIVAARTGSNWSGRGKRTNRGEAHAAPGWAAGMKKTNGTK